MALDREYFDSINIEIAKKKYYNANKVNALLSDIREQAIALTEENERLRAQVRELSAKASVPDDTAQQHALKCVEKCLFALRQREMDTVALINSSWQEFLSGLIPEDADTPEKASDGLLQKRELERWVDAIAREMNEINGK